MFKMDKARQILQSHCVGSYFLISVLENSQKCQFSQFRDISSKSAENFERIHGRFTRKLGELTLRIVQLRNKTAHYEIK